MAVAPNQMQCQFYAASHLGITQEQHYQAILTVWINDREGVLDTGNWRSIVPLDQALLMFIVAQQLKRIRAFFLQKCYLYECVDLQSMANEGQPLTDAATLMLYKKFIDEDEVFIDMGANLMCPEDMLAQNPAQNPFVNPFPPFVPAPAPPR